MFGETLCLTTEFLSLFPVNTYRERRSINLCVSKIKFKMYALAQELKTLNSTKDHQHLCSRYVFCSMASQNSESIFLFSLRATSQQM